MIRRLLALFGYRVEYRCHWGVYSHRYDGIDHAMGRPIHKAMSVSPPWAKRFIVRESKEKAS